MSVTSVPPSEPANPFASPPSPSHGAVKSQRAASSSGRHAYDRSFWFAYAGNSLMMMGVALLYRHADFVTFLGGDDMDLGWIVGAGMVGSMTMRIAQGVGIDRYGARAIWMLSIAGCLLSMLGHLLVTSADTPPIYLLRIAYTTSLAGAFGASFTSVARRLSVDRMAEVIGMLGTSGFVAMGLSPFLGDLVIGPPPHTRGRLDLMFMIAAGFAVLALICIERATRGEERPTARRRPPLIWLLKRYHPGTILLMGVTMGVGITLPMTFLPRFAKSVDIGHLGGFYAMYAFTAFATRVITRHFFVRYGIRAMTFLGIGILVTSFLCYIPVQSWLGLVVPGIFGGMAHALLFPAIVAGGSAAFPSRYRGLGNTLMLATFDAGTLIGAPLVGAILTYSPLLSLPPYPTAFIVISAVMAAATGFYALKK